MGLPLILADSVKHSAGVMGEIVRQLLGSLAMLLPSCARRDI